MMNFPVPTKRKVPDTTSSEQHAAKKSMAATGAGVTTSTTLNGNLFQGGLNGKSSLTTATNPPADEHHQDNAVANGSYVGSTAGVNDAGSDDTGEEETTEFTIAEDDIHDSDLSDSSEDEDLDPSVYRGIALSKVTWPPTNAIPKTQIKWAGTKKKHWNEQTWKSKSNNKEMREFLRTTGMDPAVYTADGVDQTWLSKECTRRQAANWRLEKKLREKRRRVAAKAGKALEPEPKQRRSRRPKTNNLTAISAAIKTALPLALDDMMLSGETPSGVRQPYQEGLAVTKSEHKVLNTLSSLSIVVTKKDTAAITVKAQSLMRDVIQHKRKIRHMKASRVSKTERYRQTKDARKTWKLLEQEIYKSINVVEGIDRKAEAQRMLYKLFGADADGEKDNSRMNDALDHPEPKLDEEDSDMDTDDGEDVQDADDSSLLGSDEDY